MVLYLGLGMVMVGLVITGVGLGEKGFKSIEFKVVGPVIVSSGGILGAVRILACLVPYYRSKKSDSQEQKKQPVENARPKTGLEHFENREIELSYNKGSGQGEDEGYRQLVKPVRILQNNNEKVNRLANRIRSSHHQNFPLQNDQKKAVEYDTEFWQDHWNT